MPQVRPFRGVLYNPEKVPDLKEVITPPYDVISAVEQEAYHERHPQNMIRLVLGRIYPGDAEYDNRYTRAAASFRKWLEAGILKQDQEPAFYVTEIDFELDGPIRTRFGFIVRVRLESFENGGILPHEKTFSTVKADRMRLMEQCQANFSPIFSLFPDPDNCIVERLRGAIRKAAPDMAFTDLKGYHHRLWRVTSQQVHEEVEKKLAGRRLYIADGHHRYETALSYRNRFMARRPELGPDAACNYVMMSLSSMEDAGLAIRPVHRVICGVEEKAVETFVDTAGRYFEIETLGFDGAERSKVEKTFLERVKSGAHQQVIGAALHKSKAFYVLQLKEAAKDALSQATPAPLKKLDVTVATQLILQDILGLGSAALDDESRILYVSRADDALKAIHEAQCPIALILNPAKLRQIQEVSEAGLMMPRKSTYFYPKVMTGLVINKMNDE